MAKAKQQFNKLRFVSIQLMRFNDDMLKVENNIRSFVRMFSIYYVLALDTNNHVRQIAVKN